MNKTLKKTCLGLALGLGVACCALPFLGGNNSVSANADIGFTEPASITSGFAPLSSFFDISTDFYDDTYEDRFSATYSLPKFSNSNNYGSSSFAYFEDPAYEPYSHEVSYDFDTSTLLSNIVWSEVWYGDTAVNAVNTAPRLHLTCDRLVMPVESLKNLSQLYHITMPTGTNYRCSFSYTAINEDGLQTNYSEYTNNLRFGQTAQINYTYQSLWTSCIDKMSRWYITINGEKYVNWSNISISFIPIGLFGSNLDTNNYISITESTAYTYGTYLTEYNRYENWLAGKFVADIEPAPTDVLFGPVKSFLNTEIFDGFSFGSLLTISLGVLLFFLFLKIFVGG